ncbi:transcription factor TFIIIC subunit tfc4 [Arachnomyces sp. PD_36]|nr:transcription factor TFIIIC subunit tfc4 [Arachnomyces sp. PD_36]
MEDYDNNTPGESSNYRSIYPEPEDIPLSTWQPNRFQYQQLERARSTDEEDDSNDDMSVDEYDAPPADDSDEDSTYEFPAGESTGTESDDNEEDEEEIHGRRRRRRRRSGSGARGGQVGKRGPRKTVEPGPEFKALHSEATSAFIDGQYDKAADLVKQAIRLNPEVFAAHSLLSEIYVSQGDKDRAVKVLFSGAHTRPRDPSVWIKVAKLILGRVDGDRASSLKDVLYCYSRVLDIDPKDNSIRFHRASICRELGHHRRAAVEYEKILKELPHNMEALRQLAETCIDMNDVEKAKTHYDEAINYYTSLSLEDSSEFTWSDVNIYVELFSYMNEYEQGLVALKFLSRWLLGRGEDDIWESIQQDDREWDAEDYPRRLQTPGFEPEEYPLDSYGLGLPMELRVKLGIYRLKMGPLHKEEALYHLDWLEPEDTSPGGKLFEFTDLFRETADALKEAKEYELALRFYVPLQQTQERTDTSFFMAMGECFMECGETEEGESCYLTVAMNDEDDMEVRVILARFYEKMGLYEKAFKYVNQVVELGRRGAPSRKHRETRAGRLARELMSGRIGGADGFRRRSSMSKPPESPTPNERDIMEEPDDIVDHIQYLYSKLMELRPKMREGDEEATEDWLDIADALLRDFRSNRVFFPQERYMMFLGYSREAKRKLGILRTTTLLDEMQDMARRLQAALGHEEPEQLEIPNDYHNISFDEWLDVFLEYSLILAGQGDVEDTNDALAAASDASIWHHSKESMLRIHICWFTCALRLQDEVTLSNVARWFMKEYQFVTDASRLFAILSRLNTGDPKLSPFNSTASIKFMLRQIKAMDFSLPPSPTGPSTHKIRTRSSIYHERAALSSKDEDGNPICAESMDVALLVLYGHILYAGNSFISALNYFFRAYALDPENPAVLISIGLSYIHQALKRQSDNRHYLIMEGISFMEEYRRARLKGGDESVLPQERQEMEFNFARVWHMLGIAHLAVKGYERCLEISDEIQRVEREREKGGGDGDSDGKKGWVEDFGKEAAVALQGLYGMSGEMGMAKRVTERWLVI